MGINRELDLHLTRRQLFGLSARGIGIGALASLLGPDGLSAAQDAGVRRGRRDPKTGGLVGLPHHAPRAKRVIFLHQSGGPSQLETFDYKPGLEKAPGHADSRLRPPGSARRADDGAIVAARGEVDLQVRAARRSRHLGQRAAAAHGEDRRRHHRHQDDVHRCDQSRPGDHVHPDRVPAAGPAEHGRLAQLRPRHREPEPAVVRGAAVAGAGAHRGSAALLAALGERLPAIQLSGRPLPRRRDAGALSRRSARVSRTTRRRCSTPSPRSTR